MTFRQVLFIWLLRRVDGLLVRLWCPLNGHGDRLPDWVHEIHLVPTRTLLGFCKWARPWFDLDDERWFME